jgi:hypothetical protein
VYDIAVFYRKGTDNTAADFLSHKEYTDPEIRTMMLQPDRRLASGNSRPKMPDQQTQANYDVSAVIVCEPVVFIAEIATLKTCDLSEQLRSQIGAFSLYTGARDNSDKIFGLPTDWHLEQLLNEEMSYVVRNIYHTEPSFDLNEQTDDIKRLRAAHEQLVREDGCLFFRKRKASSEYGHSERTCCLVVLNKWRLPLTTLYHASKNMAHQGPYQMYLRSQVTYWWPSMKTTSKRHFRIALSVSKSKPALQTCMPRYNRS